MLLLAGSFTSCTEKEKYEQIPFIQVAKGSLPQCGDYCVYQKINAIFTFEEEWERFKTAIDRDSKVTDGFSETEIDFDKNQIIAIIGEFRTYVWDINITCITEYSDKIVVTVTEENTKGITFPSETQPYQIIKIPILTKRVEFKYVSK